MSKRLIDLSLDLKKLRDEGFDIEIRSGHLLMKDVPYVNPRREVKRGILVSELTLSGDTTTTPKNHVVDFIGELPCDVSGAGLSKVVIGSGDRVLGENLTVNHQFSSKPVVTGVYPNYYDKMTAYANILTSHAEVLEPGVKAQTFPAIPTAEGESIFEYLDTATSRAGIGAMNSRLELGKVAIVGVGGTGAYVLDLVSKTPVKEIHLFDGDLFLNHNAFRAPGAASLEELKARPKKVAYLKERYSKMHRGIIAHDRKVDATNVAELREMDFVFLCIDPGGGKKVIVESLEEFRIRFVDVGMGVEVAADALSALLRVTTSTPEKRDHFRKRVSISEDGGLDEYAANIQIADLNALNAALAVVKWKKLCAFYVDLEREHHSTYSVDTNVLTSDESL